MNNFDVFLLNEIEIFLNYKIECSNYQSSYSLTDGLNSYEYNLLIPNKCVDPTLIHKVNLLKNYKEKIIQNSLHYSTEIELINFEYTTDFLTLKFKILLVEKIIQCGKIEPIKELKIAKESI